MIEEARVAPPHGILLAAVLVLVAAGPGLVDTEAMLESISEILSSVGLLLLPLLLILLIRFLSPGRGLSLSEIFSAGEPDTIHRLGGSPIGVALFLLLILVLIYNRVSLFGSGDDDSGGD